jgi:hypothetical protein
MNPSRFTNYGMLLLLIITLVAVAVGVGSQILS